MKTVVNFHNFSDIPDDQLKFAVILAKQGDLWIFCRHESRKTWEIPGGHREHGETIEEVAKRELYEETGALEFDLLPICVYSATKNSTTRYGALYKAEIKKLGALSEDFEIEEIKFFDDIPDNLTYPDIQKDLFEYVTSDKAGRR